MTKIKEMSKRERKVLDACHNGWFMSGEYRALVDGHERRFWADSQKLLFKDVDEWFSSHEQNHADSHLLVKCVCAA